MQNSAPKNSFNRIELNRWFTYAYDCFWCQLTKPLKKDWNRADCFHHILGRSVPGADSLLNASPLSNNFCHLPIHGKLKRPENQFILLQCTFKWLTYQGYFMNDGELLTKSDKLFMNTYLHLYEEIIKEVRQTKNKAFSAT